MQPLLYLWVMTYVATYKRICHIPDVRYDIMSRATMVGNALLALAFPSRDRHTMVFTGPYLGREGPDTRYTGLSSTKRSWLPYHRDIWIIILLKNECNLSGVDTQILPAGKKHFELHVLSGGGDAKTLSIPSASAPYEPPGEAFTT